MKCARLVDRVALGLAIVKHACERLGAVITIDSEVGKGTTVTVTVPPGKDEQ